MVTPEERSAIVLRIAELKARMEALDHLRKPENIAEWAALYEARETLEKFLDEQPKSLDPGPPNKSTLCRRP